MRFRQSRAGSHVSPSAVYAAGRSTVERRVFAVKGCGERGKAPWAGGAVSLHSTGQVGPVTYLLSSSRISMCVCVVVGTHKYLQQQQQQRLYNVYIPARAHYTRSGLNRLPSVYFLYYFSVAHTHTHTHKSSS